MYAELIKKKKKQTFVNILCHLFSIFTLGKCDFCDL